MKLICGNCGKARRGPLTPDQCGLCWTVLNNPRYANAASVPAPPKPAKPSPCSHLGSPTGEFRQCKTCAGMVKLSLFSCAIHGSCTPAKKLDGIACCVGCADFSAS